MRVEMIDGAQLDDRRDLQAQVIMAMPSLDSWTARRCARLMASRAGRITDGLILVIIDHQREGFVRLINRSFARCACEHFGYVAEDAFPGRAWLQLAQISMQQRSAKLLAFNDGKWMGKMASFGLVEREWAATLYDGALFHPGYQQHYADYELSRIAQHQRVFAFEPASVLIEIDWDKDGKRTNPQDKALFEQRSATAFGGLTRQ